MPYERKDFPYPLRVGADIRSVQNLQQVSNDIYSGIDFVMIDVCNALNFRDEKTIVSRDIALTRPGKVTLPNQFLDTCISSGWWINNIVIKINSYLT